LAHVGNFEPAGARCSGLAGGIGQYLTHDLGDALGTQNAQLQRNRTEREGTKNLDNSGRF
jgi:hypothetical protein